MKITHIITRLIVGGAQENTLASALGLRQDPAFDVDLFAGPTSGPEGSLQPQAETIPGFLTLVPSLVRPVSPWHDILALGHLTRLLRRRQPDVVHTHSGKAGVLGRLAARRARVPLVVHTIHGPSFGPFQGRPANTLFRTAERIAGRFTTHFVVVANAMRDQYLRAGIGQPHQYTRIFSGFPLAPYLHSQPDPDQRARLGLDPDDFVVGTVARLFKLKGHDDLLNIAPQLLRRCPRLRFLWVGDGDWRPRLEARASRLGVRSRVTFAGLVPPATIPGFLAQMDVLAHLSRREGLARALPQALAAGRPVVAYDCDGAREVCLHQETGLLLRPDNPAALLEALLQLERDPALCRRLASRGRELATEQFPVEHMVTALARLYRELAAHHARPESAIGPPTR